jgi:hypothetical protein
MHRNTIEMTWKEVASTCVVHCELAVPVLTTHAVAGQTNRVITRCMIQSDCSVIYHSAYKRAKIFGSSRLHPFNNGLVKLPLSGSKPTALSSRASPSRILLETWENQYRVWRYKAGWWAKARNKHGKNKHETLPNDSLGARLKASARQKMVVKGKGTKTKTEAWGVAGGLELKPRSRWDERIAIKQSRVLSIYNNLTSEKPAFAVGSLNLSEHN